MVRDTGRNISDDYDRIVTGKTLEIVDWKRYNRSLLTIYNNL
jgi:hypothetical protein